MRPWFAIFLSAALLSALFAAFVPSAYLYEGEEPSSIVTEEFAASGATYTLVTIGGHETFLLRDGVQLNSTPEIYSVMREHMLQSTNFDSEAAKIREGILKFNASRDKKVSPTSIFRTESMCKRSFVPIPCSTLAECIGTASVVCQIDPTVSCDAGLLGRGIFEFYPPSVQLDKDVSAALDAANSITLDNAGAKIELMKQKFPLIRTSAGKMEHSILRDPGKKPSDSCNQNNYYSTHQDECLNLIGACYPMDFDYASLTSAENAANGLYEQLSGAASLQALSEQIASNTQERIDFKMNSALIAQYNAKFGTMKSKYPAIISQVERLSPLIADEGFQVAAARLSSKGTDIESSIAQKQFSRVDPMIADYEKLVLAANATLGNLSQVYNTTLRAQDAASDSLIEAEWAINTKDPGVASDYNKLKGRQAALDSSFKPPLTSSKYISLKSDYNALASDAKSFTGNRARNILFSISGGAGRSGADSLLALASTVRPLQYDDRVKLAPAMPPILLALTGLSIVSLALVAFAAVLLAFRSIFRQRLLMVIWVVALLAFLVVVGAGSAGAYVMLNQSSPGATLSEFMSDVKSGGSAFVLVDGAGATDASISSMESCAAKISNSLAAEGVKVSSYKTAGAKCYINGKASTLTPTDCLNSISRSGDPMFHLKYSSAPKSPLFTLLVSKEAQISGDAAYMDRCVIQDAMTNR